MTDAAPNDSVRESEQRLRAIVDTAVDAIITIRDDGIIDSFNRAGETMFGYEAEEAIGKNVSLLMPSPYREEHDDYLANYLTTGDAKIIGLGREVVGRRKDGSTFPIHLSVSKVQLGGRVHFTGIVRDISEEKEAEQRALQAERLAAIGQTVAGLAHESRNAFQRSQACLEMLSLELQDQPEQLELVERTQRSLAHLHHLYEEVRNYAAPINLDRQPCNLAHVWRDAWSQLEQARGEKSIELIEEIADTHVMCDLDWFAMGQVFRNILENAIAACPDSGRVAICCESTTLNDRDWTRVSITDNGPGIADDARGKVFHAFFTTKTKGTGLGMAIARRIVEAHGGDISIGDNNPGARFVINLPVRTAI